ncbi:hypothetical protein H9Q72_014507, partial [Fusarium xylarioides]
SSASAITPHESEVKLPSNNNTAPKTPCPAKKKNSSAAVTPVKTPKTPKTSHASKRKLKFPEGKDPCYLLPPAITLCNAIANGIYSEITHARTCASVMFKLFKAHPTLFTISDRHILPSRVFEIPRLGL